jgi:hypothetical protein
MANFSENRIQILGTKENIEKLYQELEKLNVQTCENFFDHFFPTPQAVDEKDGEGEWFDWRFDNWGTKWNPVPASIYMMRDSDTSILLSMNTAWGPPNKFLNHLSKKYNMEVENEYEDLGNEFFGIYHCKNGEILLDQYNENDEDDED